MEKEQESRTGWKWAEGFVDPSAEHIELYYGDPKSSPRSWRRIAMVGKPECGTFPVTWIANANDTEEAIMIETARKDLDFYLLDAGGPDPWVYAKYHCSTSANMYSLIHWVDLTDGRTND